MPINVGFIGTGKAFDDVHFPILSKLDGYRIVGVFDIEKDRAELASKRAGCSTFSTYRRMLTSDEIDIVLVTTPSNTHAKYSIQALDAGKHVVVDKPPATTLVDLKKMLAAAKRNRRMLITFLNRRWDGDYLAVRKALKSGKIGSVFYMESNVLDTSYGEYGVFKKWRRTRKYGGGQLLGLELAAHQWGLQSGQAPHRARPLPRAKHFIYRYRLYLAFDAHRIQLFEDEKTAGEPVGVFAHKNLASGRHVFQT